MDFYEGAGWTGFFAQMSTSATLTGLIFVAISINLKQVLQFPALQRRANPSAVLANPGAVQLDDCGCTGQPVEVLGSGLLVLGVAAAIGVVALDFATLQIMEERFRCRMIALSPMSPTISLTPAADGDRDTKIAAVCVVYRSPLAR